jgi:hypothetical protein
VLFVSSSPSPGRLIRGCQVCGCQLADDWYDDFCAPCVDRLYARLAKILLDVHAHPYAVAPTWAKLLRSLRRRRRRVHAA